MTTTASDTTLAVRLRISLARLSRLSRSALREVDLTPSQLSVLAAIDSSQGIRLGELAAGQGMTPPSATRIVQVLVERGLVERATDSSDKRACVLGTSDQGREVLKLIRCQTTDLFTDRIGALSRGDKTKLHLAITALERLAGVED